MKKVLITGAGGFVGTHLIRALQDIGNYEIFAAVYQSTSDITTLISPDHIIAGDLTRIEFASTLIEQTKPDVVYHLAALSVVHNSVEKALGVMTGNTAISYNILEAIKRHAPEARFVAICSANEYGAVIDKSRPIKETVALRPLNPYAVSKVTQEMLALQYALADNLDCVIIRPFNHTGPGQTTDFVIPRLATQFAKIEKGLIPPVVEVGNLGSVRDFTDVSDMVQGYILAAEHGIKGEIYNIGSGEGHTIQEILDILQRLCSIKVEIKINDAFVRTSDVPILIADASKFKDLTSWSPKVPLVETIKHVYNYCKEQS